MPRLNLPNEDGRPHMPQKGFNDVVGQSDFMEMH